MKNHPSHSATRDFQEALAIWPRGRCVLRLFVAGATVRSRLAILRVRQLCDDELQGRFNLEVIDIYQQPTLARDNQIIATPTLIREYPRPIRRLIGNLTNPAELLAGLDLSTGRNVTTP